MLIRGVSERVKKREITCHRPHVEKDESVFRPVELGLADPGMEVTDPRGQGLPPARITRHVISRTQGIAAGGERILRECGHLSEILTAGVVHVVGKNEGVILVGLEGLFAAAFAP